MKHSAELQLHHAVIVDMATQYHTANPRIFGSVLHGTVL